MQALNLWAEETGSGPAVLFVHGGLGDSRLWEPVARIVAERFRCIRYDQRFFGRSTGPAEEWSAIDDAVEILDRFDVDRAAIVGLSAGGGIALDLALDYPERVWAIAHVAGAVPGIGFDVAEPAELADADEMTRDFAVWAPLGTDELLRELWLATPDARDLPAGAQLRPRPQPRAGERLEEVAVPTLVVTATHDPPSFREVGRAAAVRIPGAQLVEIDSDHYLSLRVPQQLGELLLEFLTGAAPSSDGHSDRLAEG